MAYRTLDLVVQDQLTLAVVKMKIWLILVLMVAWNSNSHADAGLFTSVSVGQITIDKAYQRTTKLLAYEVGVRSRYLLSQGYLGAEAGIGRFDEVNMSSAWLDVGLTRQFVNNSLRINFGGGMAYKGYAGTVYHSTSSFAKEYGHRVFPFIAADYELWRILVRAIYQLESHLDARLSIGFRVL